VPPYELPKVLGRVALKALEPDESIRLEMLAQLQS
jgi:hypothetical protein